MRKKNQKQLKILESLEMPFKSEKQRRFLYKNEPAVAKKWTKKYGSKISKPKKRKKSQTAFFLSTNHQDYTMQMILKVIFVFWQNK